MVYFMVLTARITKSWFERELRCFTSAVPARQFTIKCWPQQTYSDISPQHEQKHLLHHRSNRCYRNRAQIARTILGTGFASAVPEAKIFFADRRSDTQGFSAGAGKLTLLPDRSQLSVPNCCYKAS